LNGCLSTFIFFPDVVNLAIYTENTQIFLEIVKLFTFHITKSVHEIRQYVEQMNANGFIDGIIFWLENAHDEKRNEFLPLFFCILYLNKEIFRTMESRYGLGNFI
jgi:hypothetical protein